MFGYINSRTGRTYELTEYVNDTNREYTEVLAEYRINAGVDHESYSYAGRMRISKNSFWNEARDIDCDQMSYYLYDGRGSVTANTWYNGMVIAVYQYDPYGQVTLGGEKYRDFYGYNAEVHSSNTGLQYLRARYYSAEQGRFQSEDLYLGEIRDPLSLNRYGYTNNSPLNYQDPSGHISLSGIKDAFEQTKELVQAIQEDQDIVLTVKKKVVPELKKDIIEALRKTANWIQERDREMGYRYNPDPTAEVERRFDADQYSDETRNITNYLAFLLGSLREINQNYEKETGMTIGEKIDQTIGDRLLTTCMQDNLLNDLLHNSIVDNVARQVGFIYDGKNDIYHTRKNAMQHLFGFNAGIDDMEFLLGMNLNSLPIDFQDSKGNDWKLELWNGQYGLGLSTGAEVGLYRHYDKKLKDPKHYRSANMEDWIHISWELRADGNPILSRSSDDYAHYYRKKYGEYANKDWWLAGFKVGEYHSKESLSMTVKIELTEKQNMLLGENLEKALNDVKMNDFDHRRYGPNKKNFYIKYGK